jgi:hypothetical protein
MGSWISGRAVVLKLQFASESFLKLIKAQISGPNPRVSEPVGLRQDPRICISEKFPSDDAGAAGWKLGRTTTES